MKDTERKNFIEKELFISYSKATMKQSDYDCSNELYKFDNFSDFHAYYVGRYNGLCDMLRSFHYDAIFLKDRFLILYRRPAMRDSIYQMQLNLNME